MREGTTLPVTWEFDISNYCNHHCPGCSGGFRKGGLLSQSEIKNYLLQIADLEAAAIIFTGGGEPCMNDCLADALLLAKERKLDVALVTNGSLINLALADRILEACTWIRVSLDAASEEMFKKVHGVNLDGFTKVLEGISLLVAEKRRLNSPCTIGVAFLTSAETKIEMVSFTKLCKSFGVDYVQFRPFHFDKTDVMAELFRCKQLENGSFKVLWSQNKYEHFGEQKRPYKVCYGHHFASVINLHSVYLCCHLRGNEKYNLGDLREKSLREIWMSKYRQKVYNHIDYKDCTPLCRCDPFNRRLWCLKCEQPKHLNFL